MPDHVFHLYIIYTMYIAYFIYHIFIIYRYIQGFLEVVAFWGGIRYIWGGGSGTFGGSTLLKIIICIKNGNSLANIGGVHREYKTKQTGTTLKRFKCRLAGIFIC